MARNKAYRRNSGAWAVTNPAARLAVLRQVMDIPAQLIHRLLWLAGEEWELEQEILASKGQPRSYRMLEAAKNSDAESFLDSVMQQMRQQTRALPAQAQTLRIRSMHFRVLGRAACALHFLLKKPRQGQPFQLFRALEHQDALQYRPGPTCLEDELASEFYTKFPQWNPAAEACLQALARAIQMDVSAIESKHALSRRIALIRSTNTWTAQLQRLSAEWMHSQMRKASLQGPQEPDSEDEHQQPQEGDGEGARPQAKRRRRVGPGKQPGARGGGGGAWRAFLHEYFSGHGRMTGSQIQQAADVYRNLDPDEKSRFWERGQQALMAWRNGYASFGQRNRARQAQAGLPAGLGDGFEVNAIAVRDFQQDCDCGIVFWRFVWLCVVCVLFLGGSLKFRV